MVKGWLRFLSKSSQIEYGHFNMTMPSQIEYIVTHARCDQTLGYIVH